MQIDAETEAVIDALLPQIAFDGWTQTSLRQAMASIGQAPEDAKLIFPGGTGEMIEAFFALSIARMEAAAAQEDLAAHRLPARVRMILALWFEQNRGNKEAIRRALSWLSLPGNLARGLRIKAAMVDAVWHAAGDMSADFSWYTKRGILAAVFSATLLYWLNDHS
ncbi:MAG TPA: COQ9 family protein, partial [Acidocella sp.]|nr:COQ9 family protein [Acidocella sp.]